MNMHIIQETNNIKIEAKKLALEKIEFEKEKEKLANERAEVVSTLANERAEVVSILANESAKLKKKYDALEVERARLDRENKSFTKKKQKLLDMLGKQPSVSRITYSNRVTQNSPQ